MKIVVLDGHTANPGDLSWAPFEELGSLTVHARTAPDEILARAGDAEIVLTNKTPLDREVLGRLPKLRYVGVLATGWNVVDGTALAERRIPLCNVPAYSTPSVAQHTFALLLECCHRAGAHGESVRAGGWTDSRDFSYCLSPQVELAGKTLGIIGFGAIGEAVARIALAFGMKVVASSRTPKSTQLPVDFMAMQELLRQSDVVSLHCPLTESTRGLVEHRFLEGMKRGAILLNTSRGGLVVEEDLAGALERGLISAAGLDVLSAEPPQASNPLLRAPRCIITPHIAWASFEARSRLLGTAASNLRAFLDGKPRNVVNGV